MGVTHTVVIEWEEISPLPAICARVIHGPRAIEQLIKMSHNTKTRAGKRATMTSPLMRKGGPHQAGAGALRQSAKRAWTKEIHQNINRG